MLNQLRHTYNVLYESLFYRTIMFILSLPVAIVAIFKYIQEKKHVDMSLDETALNNEVILLEQKYNYLNKNVSRETLTKKAKVNLLNKIKKQNEILKKEQFSFRSVWADLLFNQSSRLISFIFSFLLWGFLFIYNHPYSKYIFERLVMFVFVVIGVIFVVFTLLYLSPTDPAANILGDMATEEQIKTFNETYGLNESYMSQLFENIGNIFTLDLGQSFKGGEDILQSIITRLPITLILTISALIIAVVIAIPIGVLSGVKRNTFLDGFLMTIALIGLSIPNFWFGLILILNFAIRWHLLPASYIPGNVSSMILPIVVLGTGLTASIARMTRSSVLEVLQQDYVVTAKSKGLKNSYIIREHVLRNALVPIITLIGILFSGLLGGVAVTEKVFGVDGIGSYIVDKQFIPDIPAVMAGVVYVAIVISFVNLMIDLIYTFIDPRIRKSMK